jgi:hypothetical protein
MFFNYFYILCDNLKNIFKKKKKKKTIRGFPQEDKHMMVRELMED